MRAGGRRRYVVLGLVVGVSTMAAGAASSGLPESRAAPCTGSVQLVRTVTLTLPGGSASFAGFASGKTYLLSFSGSLQFAGLGVRIAEAPGAFALNDVANDAFFSSVIAPGVTLPANPSAVIQRDPAGGALRYNLDLARACGVLPAAPALPGDTLEITGSGDPWSGTVAIQIFAFTRGSGAAPRTWTGSWRTNFGTMRLRQSGKHVSGTYTHRNGRIRGTASGRVLTGTWDQAPTRRGRDAGGFIFTLTKDGKSFKGRWSRVGDLRWNRTPWNGTCTGGPCAA